MGMLGKKKITHSHHEHYPAPVENPIVNTCQCSPKVAYGTESFPYKDFPPPKPPNGQEDLWELQFCRWWGWNWVRKQELAGGHHSTQETKMQGCRVADYRENYKEHRRDRSLNRKRSLGCFPRKNAEKINRPLPIYRSPSPHSPSRPTCPCYHTRTHGYPDSPLPNKRELKDLCKCLVFQKPSRELPPRELQNLYNTPSHSVVLERERYSFNRSDRQTKFAPCETTMSGLSPHRREKERRKKCSAESWCEKPQRESSVEKLIRAEALDDQNTCMPCKPASSTEESIEYLTVRMQHVKSDTRCPCQGHVQPSKKQSVQTVPVTPPREDVGCQCIVSSAPPSRPGSTDEKVIKYKGKKKKTLCICVCCCNCCKKEKDSTSVDGNKDDKTKDGLQKTQEIQMEPKNSPEKSPNNISGQDKQSFLSEFYMPINTYQIPDIKTLNSKKFTKNYSSFSNDATISIFNDDTFVSPISGKTYNFAALQFHTNDETNLPELIDASKDLEYLKSIQSSIKNESEQKILFDAVCDVLLNGFDTQSSNFLNEFSFNTDVHQIPFNLENLSVLSELNKESKKFNLDFDKNNQTLKNSFSNPSMSVSAELNKNSENDHKDFDKAYQTLKNNIFNVDNKPRFLLPNICSKTEIDLNNLGKPITPLETENDSTIEFEMLEAKANCTSQNLNSFIEEMLKEDRIKAKFKIADDTFRHLENKNEIIRRKISEDNYKTKISNNEKDILRHNPCSGIKNPMFTKTGLMSASNIKRNATFSPRDQSFLPKKYKPDKKFNFDQDSKLFQVNYVSEIDSERFEKKNPFLEPEIEKNPESELEVKRRSSFEQIKATVNNMFANIKKTKSKHEKISSILSCVSEKSEKVDNFTQYLTLKLEDTKKNNDICLETGPNRSEFESSPTELSSARDTVIINPKFESDGEKSCSAISTIRSQPSGSIGFGIKKKKKRNLGKKSFIPVRKLFK